MKEKVQKIKDYVRAGDAVGLNWWLEDWKGPYVAMWVLRALLELTEEEKSKFNMMLGVSIANYEAGTRFFAGGHEYIITEYAGNRATVRLTGENAGGFFSVNDLYPPFELVKD